MKKYANYREDFREQKRRRLISRANRILLLALLGAALVVFLLFFAKLFDVRSVEAHVPVAISAQDVQDKIQDLLDRRTLGISRRSNSIVFSPQKIRRVLLDAFPRIDSVEISRTSVHDILVIVHERTPVGLWCLPDREKCFYYDANGIAFSEILPSSGYLFVPVNDQRDRVITLGGTVAPESWRTSIAEVKKLLQFGDITVSEIDIPADSYNEFDVVTREGWKILYNRDINVRTQTNSLLALLKEKLSPATRANLDYIDLRIEDRIYYKTR